MRFKFKPQTGILVAGLLAATYAEACYYQGTSAVCVQSGTQVDAISWSNHPMDPAKAVTASADWVVYSDTGSGKYLVWSGTGPGGYNGTAGDGGSLPTYCTGPVHFQDASGNTASVASWSGGSADIYRHFNSAYTPAGAGIFAGTVDPASGTCE